MTDQITTTDSPAPTTLTKPGYQTTEFWLTTIALLLTTLYASGVIPTSGPAATIAAMAATVLTALGYKVSRTLVKQAAAALLILGLGLAAVGSSACTKEQFQAGAAASAGTAIDCEAPNVKSTLLELLALAKPAIESAITGDGHVDSTLLKAALAGLKSDAPRCAIDAAIAGFVASSAAASKPGAAMAARFDVNATELQAAYAIARAELGWPAIKSASVQ